MARTTVLFIAGWGRSGSTFLGNILGQLPGFFYAGEVYDVWKRGILENVMCGCGVRFSACPVWGAILDDAVGGFDPALAARMAQSWTVIPSNRDLLRRALAPEGSTIPERPGQAEYVRTLARLYSGIARRGGGRVIVDSTKSPGYLYMLGQVPDLDVRVVHLVRDPRATTFSWLRHAEVGRTESGEALAMQRFSVSTGASRWVASNAAVPIAARLIRAPVERIFYESFVAEPRETLHDVLSLVHDVARVPESAWPFSGPYEVDLRDTHSAWGNPKRQRTGRVAISPDSEWATRFGPWSKALVMGLTYPLARRYGYFSTSAAPMRAR